MKILLTGGLGLLGKYILKLDKKIIAPSHALFNIDDLNSVYRGIKKYQPDVVLHLAAETNPPAHDDNPNLGIITNIIGTAYLAAVCWAFKIKLIYLSTDYVYCGKGPHKENESVCMPSNFVKSKLGGECAVSMLNDYLIIRCSFGPYPFPYERVYDDQKNSKMYVNEIAPLILKAAKSKLTGIVNIGSSGQSLYQYAKRTKPGIKKIKTPKWIPRDTRLNLKKWKSHFKI